MLNKIKIGTALAVGFGFALLAAVVIAAVAWVGLGGVTKGVHELSDLALVNQAYLDQMDIAESGVMRYAHTLMLPDQPALHGVLARIRDLGLTLVSLTRCEDEREQKS